MAYEYVPGYGYVDTGTPAPPPGYGYGTSSPNYGVPPMITPTPTTPGGVAPEWLAPTVAAPAPTPTSAPGPTTPILGGGGMTDGGYGAGGTVYGGQAWIQQAIDAAIQAAMQQINWSQLMGYGYPSMYGPGAAQAPTMPEAFYAIYENRPDLQEQHERKYGDWSVTRYMDHWWEGSGEMNRTRNWTDPATGIEWRNTKDQTVVQFAIARGYIDPGPEPAVNYGMEPVGGYEGDPTAIAGPWQRWAIAGEREPTLAREMYERTQTEAEEARRMGDVLQYMGLQTQMQGPRNWLQYGALQRQAAQTQIPEWQRRLQEGLGFAPFQGGAAMPSTAPPAPAYVGDRATGFIPPAGIAEPIEQNLMQPQYIQPQQVAPQQWWNMMPSEQEQLMGLIESPVEIGGYGGYAPDWLQQMQSAWPTGQATPTSYFGT